jgi:hypothetical protein
VALSAPEPIGTKHPDGDFTSGVVSLDEWLKRRALANQASGAARTFVVCEADKAVGYYALASGAVSVAAAPGRFRRNMPDPIPVVYSRGLLSIALIRAAVSAARWSATPQGASYMPPCDRHPWHYRACTLG